MLEFDDLVEIIRRLRAPGGCPWDREQDHETLKPYLLEECYEALEAVDAGDPDALCAELGDVLLQVVLHAQLGSEAGSFGIEDVCRRTGQKLTHRHPHVFGDVKVRDGDEVAENWEHLKRQETAGPPPDSAMDTIPTTLPALKRATAIQKTAARVGFDWDDITGPLHKVLEELQELRQAQDSGDQTRTAEEFGDVLFAMVNAARFLRVDAEDALRTSCGRFSRRFKEMERGAADAGTQLSQMTMEEMDQLWEEAKRVG